MGRPFPKRASRAKYGIYSTPSIQFFPAEELTLAGKPPEQREVLRLRGYVAPEEFRRTFAFVAERAYERTNLQDYLRSPEVAQRG